MIHDTWQEALEAMVKEKGLEDSELGDISKRASESGYPSSNGIAGAPGRLTHVSEILDPHQIDAFTTQGDGSRDFRARKSATSSQSNGDSGEESIPTD